MRTAALFCLALSSLALLRPAAAEDWPQWRGPARDGVSRETGLLKSWPAGGPKLLWQAKDLGSGYGAPAVAGNRIYLTNNVGLDTENVLAIDAATGKTLWTTKIGKVGKPDQQPNYPAARSTPTVDGDRLYVLGSDGDLVCLERASGKIAWQKDLVKDFGGSSGTWAYAESPLIDGNNLICTPGGKDATLLALNKRTGAVVWKGAVPGGDDACYASVMVANLGGVKQYVQFLRKGLVGFDARTGKVLWRYDKTANAQVGASIMTPVLGDNCVYTGTNFVGGGLVRIVAKDGGLAAEEAYLIQKLPGGIGGAIRVGDYLYGAGGQTLSCVDFKTGAVRWNERCVGPGSVVAADDRIYVHGENGDMALVEASASGYKEVGRFTLPDQPEHRQGMRAWAYPAVANGRLYIRDASSLWCYDVKALR